MTCASTGMEDARQVVSVVTVEEYILQVKDIDLRIRSLEGELHDSEAESDAEYAVELQRRIKADIAKFKQLKLQIREEIQQLRDNRYSTLLIEYYIRGKSWEQVAQALDMKDTKNVRDSMRRRALEAFEKKFTKRFQNMPSNTLKNP